MLKLQKNAQIMFDEINEMLKSSTLLPGNPVPSELELGKKYSISRPTVRKVLEIFCQHGLMEKRQGIGTFVKEAAYNDDMIREFRIGSDFLGQKSEYYVIPILQGILQSQYGQNCYFNFFDTERFEQSNFNDKVDGLILNSGSKLPVNKITKPVVFLNYENPSGSFASIRIDHYMESLRAMDFLIRQGHKRIGIISVGDSRYPHLFLRTNGANDALKQHGMNCDAELTVPYFPNPDILAANIRKLCRTQKIDALYFLTGSAFKCTYLTFQKELGRTLDEISIMIFDDAENFHELAERDYAYIKMPLTEFGAKAVEYLRYKAADPLYPVLNKVLPCSMVVKYK